MNSNSDNEQGGTRLQTVERALAFLEAVAAASEPILIREIANRLELNISTAYHLLNTLEQAGYVARNRDGAIRIGSKVAALFDAFTREFESSRAVWPVVRALSERTGETAYLASLNEGGVTIEYLVESHQAVRVGGLHLGLSGDEHIRASGKAILAHLPDRRREEIIERALTDEPRSERSVARARLDTELTTVRSRGYAIDEGDFLPGVTCVAAAFFDHAGSIAGAMSLALPAERYDRKPDTYSTAIRDAARAASDVLAAI